MIPNYQFYHGAILHDIVLAAGKVGIEVCNFHGRQDAYVLDGSVGLLIKHSSARLSPWSFTFTKEHIGELNALAGKAPCCFVGLICDEDGFVCLRDENLRGFLDLSGQEVVTLRVHRRPRKMYGVSSSYRDMDRKIAKGVDEVVAEIKRRRLEYVPPSSST